MNKLYVYADFDWLDAPQLWPNSIICSGDSPHRNIGLGETYKKFHLK